MKQTDKRAELQSSSYDSNRYNDRVGKWKWKGAILSNDFYCNIRSLHTLDGCEVAYPTRQKMRQMRNTAPGTIPNASGLFINNINLLGW